MYQRYYQTDPQPPSSSSLSPLWWKILLPSCQDLHSRLPTSQTQGIGQDHALSLGIEAGLFRTCLYDYVSCTSSSLSPWEHLSKVLSFQNILLHPWRKPRSTTKGDPLTKHKVRPHYSNPKHELLRYKSALGWWTISNYLKKSDKCISDDDSSINHKNNDSSVRDDDNDEEDEEFDDEEDGDHIKSESVSGMKTNWEDDHIAQFAWKIWKHKDRPQILSPRYMFILWFPHIETLLQGQETASFGFELLHDLLSLHPVNNKAFIPPLPISAAARKRSGHPLWPLETLTITSHQILVLNPQRQQERTQLFGMVSRLLQFYQPCHRIELVQELVQRFQEQPSFQSKLLDCLRPLIWESKSSTSAEIEVLDKMWVFFNNTFVEPTVVDSDSWSQRDSKDWMAKQPWECIHSVYSMARLHVMMRGKFPSSLSIDSLRRFKTNLDTFWSGKTLDESMGERKQLFAQIDVLRESLQHLEDLVSK